ncbi:hypothetical protein B0T16DRAFT_386662 [Cercophora newfieldiana]|uniref:DUF7730 domain-containing protein n=1 Tax=Cercophora newfieldiana TaxID=92897 RepID=A0AA39YEI5_9PEZI|nr:hypothetical protein B0T16DRAFT_386662 [Cercophora newfieldiana]
MKDLNLFARIPPEIREVIYVLILTSSVPIIISHGEDAKDIAWQMGGPKYTNWFHHDARPFSALPGSGLSPAILRSCRLIYNEAIPALYGNNTFKFPQVQYKVPQLPAWDDLQRHEIPYMLPFMQHIGRGAELIRSIVIDIPDRFFIPGEVFHAAETSSYLKPLERVQQACPNLSRIGLHVERGSEFASLLGRLPHANTAHAPNANAPPSLSPLKTIPTRTAVVLSMIPELKKGQHGSLVAKEELGWLQERLRSSLVPHGVIVNWKAAGTTELLRLNELVSVRVEQSAYRKMRREYVKEVTKSLTSAGRSGAIEWKARPKEGLPVTYRSHQLP